MTNRFTWGDTVCISSSAPIEMRPGALGVVCGIRTDPYRAGVVEPANLDPEIRLVYTVEFTDGQDAEVPGQLLEPPLTPGLSSL